ncbi:Mu transposase C-terminal domain-containing protein [Streptomyces nojiriensis]|uniref:Mu transposase C-terminal domain-containing protein n=1 Tax=Streptomyces nojiriensis TaxID=66374 RepID=UPI00365B223C
MLDLLSQSQAKAALQTLAARAATHVDLSTDLLSLVVCLKDAGRKGTLEAFAARAAAQVEGTTSEGIAQLLRALREKWAEEAWAEEAVQTLTAPAAAHTDLQDLYGVVDLLSEMTKAGKQNAVQVLATRAAEHAPLTDAYRVGALLSQLTEAGQSDAVRKLLGRRLVEQVGALPSQRLASLDSRLAGAAARPVVLPETIVVDRGKVFVSRAFTAACESLGISIQPAPPHAPTAKGIVERTFGTINALFCQRLPGYTGSDVTRRGPDTEKDACYSVTQLQDLLDEWLVHYHHRPHEGLWHPMMPRKALTPNQTWAALVAVAGYVPVPLTGRDYLELIPVRWQAITAAGIRIHHRTYDADLLAPHRGRSSPVAGRGGKWEIHYNPHDVRQVWVRLPDGELTEIPWIHRDHVHRPFDERTWQHIRTQAIDGNHGDAEQ